MDCEILVDDHILINFQITFDSYVIGEGGDSVDCKYIRIGITNSRQSTSDIQLTVECCITMDNQSTVSSVTLTHTTDGCETRLTQDTEFNSIIGVEFTDVEVVTNVEILSNTHTTSDSQLSTCVSSEGCVVCCTTTNDLTIQDIEVIHQGRTGAGSASILDDNAVVHVEVTTDPHILLDVDTTSDGDSTIGCQGNVRF